MKILNRNCVLFTDIRLLQVTVIMVWTFGAQAQQSYTYNTDGYACSGRDSTCSTFALYRTFQANESLAKVATYFNTTPAVVANLSGLQETTATAGLPKGQALYIPLDCRCRNTISQMRVPYTIVRQDTFTKIANTIYGGLTSFQAMITANPTIDEYYLRVNSTAWVPIFCACPTAEQIANGAKYLLTYGVEQTGEPLDFIGANFGITAEDVGAVNQLPWDGVPEEYTTVLVPLQSLLPLAAMKFPYVMPPTRAREIATARSSGRSSKDVGIISGSIAGAIAAMLVVGLLLRRGGFAKKEGKVKSDFSLVDPNLALRMFTYKELRKATKSFRRSEMLGSGGYGAVYKGTLPSGALVAVKRMRMESKHGKDSFLAEVTSLSHIRHRNLVQLRGWCHEEEEEQLLLVYDYMLNGSLDQWLFQVSADALPLKSRRSILSGVASALAYLHEECAQCVLHRDIKSSNVLLDGEMNAFLGDFGLARLIDHQKMARTTMMAGTLGYLAPEMSHTGKATKETDVFSFGVLMLEVMCGRQPLDVVAVDRGEGLLEDIVWRAWEAGNILQAADSKLGTLSLTSDAATSTSSRFSTSSVEILDSPAMEGALEQRKVITTLLQLGLLCCHPNPEERPSMRLVTQLMQCKSSEDMEMALPCLPEWKPQVFYSRPPGFRGFSQVQTILNAAPEYPP